MYFTGILREITSRYKLLDLPTCVVSIIYPSEWRLYRENRWYITQAWWILSSSYIVYSHSEKERESNRNSAQYFQPPTTDPWPLVSYAVQIREFLKRDETMPVVFMLTLDDGTIGRRKRAMLKIQPTADRTRFNPTIYIAKQRCPNRRRSFVPKTIKVGAVWYRRRSTAIGGK